MPSRITDNVEAVRGGGGAASGTNDTINPPTLSNSISAIDKSPPVPPPNVPPIQLKMWLTIIQRRKKQISKLSNTYLLSFANDIILDLLSSQENDNNEQDQNKENSEQQVLTNPLLITGYYSTYLLMTHPPPSNISIDDVILHLLALFYRSVDERLTSALNCVRRAFTKLDEWSKKFKNKDVAVDASATESGSGKMDTSSDDKIDEGKKRKSKDISNTTSDSQQEMDDENNNKKSGLKNPTETNTDGSDMSISSVDHSPHKGVRKEDDTQKMAAAAQEKKLPSQPQKSLPVANSTTDRRDGRFENGKEVHSRVPRVPGIVQRALVPESAVEPVAAASRKRPPEELAANLPPQKKTTLTSLRAVDPISQQGPQEQQPNKDGTSSEDKASPFAKELNAFTKQVAAAKTNESSADDQLHCKVCNVTCSSEQQLLDHCNGEKYRQLNGIVVQVNAPNQVDATPHNKGHKIDRPDETLFPPGMSLFIRNVPDNISEEDVRALFEPHALKVKNKVLGVTFNLVERFCFIAFDGTNAVHAIISQAQKVKSTFKIHGRILEVQRNVFKYFCKMCDVPCVNELNFQQHMRGKKHREMMKKRTTSSSTLATTSTMSQREVDKAKKPDATTASTMKTTPKKTDTPVDTPTGTSTTATINTKTADASVTNAKTKTKSSSTANTKTAATKTVTTLNASTVSYFQGKTSPVLNNNANNVLDNSNARDVYEKVAAMAKARRESAEMGHQNVALAASNAEEGKEPEINDDVIDLTEDSPSHESPSDDGTRPASVTASTSTALNRNQAIKEDEVRSSNSPPPPPPPPSPPASPIPFPIIHDLPPPSLPQPKPFMDNRKVVFLADRNPAFTSGNLQQRNSCTVEYDTGYHLDGSGSCCHDAHYIDASERLKTWDPYWKVVEELGSRQVQARGSEASKVTSVGAKTTSCRSDFNQINSCTSILVDLPMAVKQSKISNEDSKGRNLPPYRAWGCKWGNIPHPNNDKRYFESGDRRLIVRAIPLQRTEKDKKKQADGHLWPKGTFLQLKRQSFMNEQVLPLTQRKQQSHDHQKWTGQCYPLDLTNEIVNTSVPFELKLCCNEIVENASTNNIKGTLQGSYVLHVAICEYISPNDLYDQLMGKKPGDVIIPRISLRSSKKMAKEYLAGQTVSMIDSDDEDVTAESSQAQGNSRSENLSLSLLCSVSRTVIETPVRGRHCKHIQCFDLKNFLHSNSNLNGGRWRCLVCESFLNVRDLVHCGLFQNMLDSVAGQVSSARDKVKWHSDGTWRLQEENRLKYSTNSQRKKASNQDVTDMTNDDEVIELL